MNSLEVSGQVVWPVIVSLIRHRDYQIHNYHLSIITSFYLSQAIQSLTENIIPLSFRFTESPFHYGLADFIHELFHKMQVMIGVISERCNLTGSEYMAQICPWKISADIAAAVFIQRTEVFFKLGSFYIYTPCWSI